MALLLQRRIGTECCEWMEQAEFRPDEKQWAIYNGSIVYCSTCAYREGLY